jgi:F-type H+-transporting ATPase subunit b
MEATLNALGQILLQALPTFFLVLLLHQYLKAVFFKPLERVLAERGEATEGARKKAAESLERAAAKAAAYEESLRVARNEIYREHEEVRRKWLNEQTAQILAARTHADAAVKEAKVRLAAEAEAAKASLETDSRVLADQIARTILHRRAAA